MDGQDLDRNEAATPFKLQKAHDQGQAPRSADFAPTLVFGAAMVFLAWQGRQAAEALLRTCRGALAALSGAGWSEALLRELALRMAIDAAGVLLPFMLVLLAAAAAGNWLQTGFILSFDPLKADFQRINPATGLKRLFSLRTLFDGGRACVKLAVLVIAAWLALESLLPQFFEVAALSPAAFLRTLVDDTAALGLKMALALGLVAAVDIGYTRREFRQKMRMSRRELKDEFKNREGDPRIRARLRDLRREMLKRSQALRNTRDADVVVTNPTHYAVALRYVQGEMAAPRLVAKGAGQLAAAMREIAWRHRVTIVQNPPLARGLFRALAIDEEVPPTFHAEVARIIVWVFAMRQQRLAASGGAA